MCNLTFFVQNGIFPIRGHFAASAAIAARREQSERFGETSGKNRGEMSPTSPKNGPRRVIRNLTLHVMENEAILLLFSASVEAVIVCFVFTGCSCREKR